MREREIEGGRDRWMDGQMNTEREARKSWGMDG